MSELIPPCRLTTRAGDAHKGNFGRVLLVGGSRGMSGSIALSSMAALKCGSGLVSAAVPDRCLEMVATFHPCLMTVPMPDDGEGRFSALASEILSDHFANLDAIGCGPGMTTAAGSIRIVERLLALKTVPRVLDADAINSLAILEWPGNGSSDTTGPLILTPHPGELQRITGASPRDRSGQIEAARQLAAQTGAVVVVKGGPTVVVGNGQTWTNSTGNPGMATGGSGDVLTGVITSLLGQRLGVWDAACLGVWIHGRAGDLAAGQYGQAGMTALEILEALPKALPS